MIVGASVSGAEMVTNASNGGAKNIYWVVNNTERESGRKRNHWILNRWPDSNSSMMWDCNMTRETFQLKPSMFFGKFCSWIKSIHRADDQSTIVYPGDQVAISDAHEELEAFQMIIDEHKKGISPYGLLVEPYKYTDELAKDIGCLPLGISGTACEDESLNIALLRGPLISAQYHINGPNAWSGAKEYIKMKAQEIIGSN